MKKISLLNIIIACVILTMTGVFIIIMFAGTNNENEFILNDTDLVVKGQFGENYPLSALVSVELIDEMPAILSKKNGVGLSSKHIYKGLFSMDILGDSMLYIHSAEKPFILLHTDTKPVLINLKDPDDTRILFNKLESKVKSSS